MTVHELVIRNYYWTYSVRVNPLLSLSLPISKQLCGIDITQGGRFADKVEFVSPELIFEQLNQIKEHYFNYVKNIFAEIRSKLPEGEI